MTKFKEGDLVTVGNGTKVAKILNTNSSQTYLRFIESGALSTRWTCDLNLYTDSDSSSSVNTMKLFSFVDNGKTIFANQIGKTSDGLLVLEARGQAGVFTRHEDEVEEVIPYTVKIKYTKGNECHYEVPEGKLQKGDILINDKGDFATVLDVNTKSRNPMKFGKFRRVLTEEI